MPLAATVCSNMLTPAVCDPQFNTSCDVPPPNMLAPAVFGNKWETGLFLGKACSRLKKEKSIQTAVRQCLGQHWAYHYSLFLFSYQAKSQTFYSGYIYFPQLQKEAIKECIHCPHSAPHISCYNVSPTTGTGNHCMHKHTYTMLCPHKLMNVYL